MFKVSEHYPFWLPLAILFLIVTAQLNAQQQRVELTAQMLINESGIGDVSTLIDEQDSNNGQPTGQPAKGWDIGGQHSKKFPLHVTIDLGTERKISDFWLFDTNATGDVIISTGKPDQWEEKATYGCTTYKSWIKLPINTPTRYIRISRMSPTANFSEIALYEFTDEQWSARSEKFTEEKQLKERKEAQLKIAIAEAKNRPLIDLGEPFGKAYLVDEIDCAAPAGDREFAEYPQGVSQVQNILGRPARVIDPVADEGSYFTYRIGQMKLLKPGGNYILSVDYPEDMPRTIIVHNNGNESIRGFHTGPTVGDSFHPKYVNNLNESINTPLSGKWESWTQMFNLHDRFPTYLKNNKPDKGRLIRDLNPEDGFNVIICQFSAKNEPLSKGVAVSRIRLFEIPDFKALTMKINMPPSDLPHRRLFWREEMADGVIGAGSKAPENTRGVTNFLDWYRYKAFQMQFLGMNTFSKDLLEFGANQGWDSAPYGGNDWVYYNSDMKDFWNNIVKMMGTYGFDVLPYYEYSGSKGAHGLGIERRAKPLNRPDGNYTHIKWVEKATADITDPDTFEDFRKMVELTVIKQKADANFAGIWLRPRGQLPVSFSDQAIARFNQQTKPAQPVTRQTLIKDKEIYKQYLVWWEIKRRDFLVQIRDYLRSNGIDDGMVLLTNNPSEPGVSFADWTPRLVTDCPDQWSEVIKQPEHATSDGKTFTLTTPQEVKDQQMYLKALLAPGIDWGGYEIRHSRPASDPKHYADVNGCMISCSFNRYYTVNSPEALNAFRSPSGLTLMRHFALNENMMFDKNDKNLLGYFVADIEKAGPFCMMAEAIAMANGDPTMIGYLSGGNYVRGFPLYVRRFNANYLALPALPSVLLPKAASDPNVVVREIQTDKHGKYIFAVNNSMASTQVTITLPTSGKMTTCETGQIAETSNGKLTVQMYPYQLISWHVQ